jgi:hypothetical protein
MQGMMDSKRFLAISSKDLVHEPWKQKKSLEQGGIQAVQQAA